METTPGKNSLNIYVTTCDKYQHLLADFDYLFKKHWGGEYRVWSGREKYSTQLINHLKSIDDDYFILLHEDFYFNKPVNLKQLNDLEEFAQKYNVARVGLQSVKDGYEDSVEYLIADWYKLSNKHQYKMSLEASIFNREYLLKHIRAGWSAGETEIKVSQSASKDNQLVILTQKPTVCYKDAMRGGEIRIKKVDNKYKVLTQAADGSDEWADL